MLSSPCVFLFCTTPVSRQPSFIAKQMGKIFIVMPLATSLCVPLPTFGKKSPPRPAILCKHEIDAVNQVVVRRSEARMPACTGPTCQFEIPYLRGALVSSLVSCNLLSECTNAGQSPCARVSSLPWCVPFAWNIIKYIMVYHKSQANITSKSEVLL